MMSPCSEDYWLIGDTDGRKRFESGSVASQQNPRKSHFPIFSVVEIDIEVLTW